MRVHSQQPITLSLVQGRKASLNCIKPSSQGKATIIIQFTLLGPPPIAPAEGDQAVNRMVFGYGLGGNTGRADIQGMGIHC